MNAASHTSFERVKAALEHREADRIPLDIGGTMVSGININTMCRLREHLGFTAPARVHDRVTQVAATNDDLVDRLGIDVKNVWPNAPTNPGLSQELGIQDGYDRLIDEFGMGWQKPDNGGHYYDLYLSPLASARTVTDIENYPWPDPLDPIRFEGMAERARQIIGGGKASYCHRAHARRYVGTCHVATGV